MPRAGRAALLVALGGGLLGAFTTFSGLATATVLLVRAGRPIVGGAFVG